MILQKYSFYQIVFLTWSYSEIWGSQWRLKFESSHFYATVLHHQVMQISRIPPSLFSQHVYLLAPKIVQSAFRACTETSLYRAVRVLSSKLLFQNPRLMRWGANASLGSKTQM